jgi:hypothetical protein
MKISLSLEELLVMKALARRPSVEGYARLKMQSLHREKVSAILGELQRVDLVKAEYQAGEWLAGPLTEAGLAWLEAYGIPQESDQPTGPTQDD